MQNHDDVSRDIARLVKLAQEISDDGIYQAQILKTAASQIEFASAGETMRQLMYNTLFGKK